ncbi:hypothetical protein GCM10008908_05210 [Clostridium subterminale]|uniref:Uncharacterized protein n=1 Tax=Clostridium subterminale TaxID=1550 RepID=A0ABP3VSL7_CLOSU
MLKKFNAKVPKNYKGSLYPLIITSLIVILYLSVSIIIKPLNLCFRGWIDMIASICLYLIGISLIIFFATALCNLCKRKFLKNLTFTLATLLILIFSFFSFIIFAFTYSPEHTITKNNKKVIAKVHMGLLHSFTEFYEPATIFFKRPSNIQHEEFKGSYDPYK